MSEMAQLGAYDECVLFTGDADIGEAVEAVQRLGKLVWLVLPEGQDGISARLLELADGTVPLSQGDLADFVRPIVPSPTNGPVTMR